MELGNAGEIELGNADEMELGNAGEELQLAKYTNRS